MKTPPAMPYGACECGPEYKCIECRGYGPAAFEVTRDGKRIRVCTKCDLTTDTDKVLLVKPSDPADIYQNWDALGFLCIAIQLSDDNGGTE